jgi:hypothetical protein
MTTYYYPPQDLTADSSTLSGNVYGNGLYDVSYSGYRDVDGNNTPFKIFSDQHSLDDYWYSFDSIAVHQMGNYNNSNPPWYIQDYDGTASTTVDNNGILTVYNGDWIQLQLPYPIQITSYKIGGINNGETIRNPAGFVLAGSNNGTTWYLVDIQTNVTWDTSIPNTYSLSNTTLYEYFRLICTNGTENPWGPILGLLAFGEPSCFNEGTIILCAVDGEEIYIPIEKLKRGDQVKTYKQGTRSILAIGKGSMVNDPSEPKRCMYKLPKTGNMTDDLILTGGHALLVDEAPKGLQFKIEDKFFSFAENDKRCIKMENTETYTYYNLCFDNEGDKDARFGIWANGVLCETPSEKQFTEHQYAELL